MFRLKLLKRQENYSEIQSFQCLFDESAYKVGYHFIFMYIEYESKLPLNRRSTKKRFSRQYTATERWKLMRVTQTTERLKLFPHFPRQALLQPIPACRKLCGSSRSSCRGRNGRVGGWRWTFTAVHYSPVRFPFFPWEFVARSFSVHGSFEASARSSCLAFIFTHAQKSILYIVP